MTRRDPCLLQLKHGALLVLTLIFAVTAAPVYENEQTAIESYDGVEDGCYYNYNHYGEGDRIVTNEPCLNCTCHNRMLMCYLRVCPFTKPIGQDCIVEKREDQCCPVITCPEVPVQLVDNSSSSVSSTELALPDNYGCSINGKFYAEGAQVPSNQNKPCELCYCIRNMTACVMQECTLHIDGCQPIYNKGVCCPVRYSCDHDADSPPMLEDHSHTTERPTEGFVLTTPKSDSQECTYNDKQFKDGALIKTDDPCKHCYCMKGDIVCAVPECGLPLEGEGRNCTAMAPKKGQCCSDTYVCDGTETITIQPESDSQYEEELQQHIVPAKSPVKGGSKVDTKRPLEKPKDPKVDKSSEEDSAEDSHEDMFTTVSHALTTESALKETVQPHVASGEEVDDEDKPVVQLSSTLAPEDVSDKKTEAPTLGEEQTTTLRATGAELDERVGEEDSQQTDRPLEATHPTQAPETETTFKSVIKPDHAPKDEEHTIAPEQPSDHESTEASVLEEHETTIKTLAAGATEGEDEESSGDDGETTEHHVLKEDHTETPQKTDEIKPETPVDETVSKTEKPAVGEESTTQSAEEREKPTTARVEHDETTHVVDSEEASMSKGDGVKGSAESGESTETPDKLPATEAPVETIEEGTKPTKVTEGPLSHEAPTTSAPDSEEKATTELIGQTTLQAVEKDEELPEEERPIPPTKAPHDEKEPETTEIAAAQPTTVKTIISGDKETTASPAEYPIEKTESPVEQTESPVAQTDSPLEQTESPLAQTESPAEQPEEGEKVKPDIPSRVDASEGPSTDKHLDHTTVKSTAPEEQTIVPVEHEETTHAAADSEEASMSKGDGVKGSAESGESTETPDKLPTTEAPVEEGTHATKATKKPPQPHVVQATEAPSSEDEHATTEASGDGEPETTPRIAEKEPEYPTERPHISEDEQHETTELSAEKPTTVKSEIELPSKSDVETGDDKEEMQPTTIGPDHEATTKKSQTDFAEIPTKEIVTELPTMPDEGEAPEPITIPPQPMESDSHKIDETTEISSAVPEQTTLKAALPEESDEFNTIIPEKATEAPEKASESPEKATEQPEKATEQAEKSTEQPEEATVQIIHDISTEEPKKAPELPEKSTEKPEKSTEQPELATEKTYIPPTTIHPESDEATESHTEPPFDDLPPPRIPGESDCLFNGITYENNSPIPTADEPCLESCMCYDSIVRCKSSCDLEDGTITEKPYEDEEDTTAIVVEVTKPSVEVTAIVKEIYPTESPTEAPVPEEEKTEENEIETGEKETTSRPIIMVQIHEPVKSEEKTDKPDLTHKPEAPVTEISTDDNLIDSDETTHKPEIHEPVVPVEEETTPKLPSEQGPESQTPKTVTEMPEDVAVTSKPLETDSHMKPGDHEEEEDHSTTDIPKHKPDHLDDRIDTDEEERQVTVKTDVVTEKPKEKDESMKPQIGEEEESPEEQKTTVRPLKGEAEATTSVPVDSHEHDEEAQPETTTRPLTHHEPETTKAPEGESDESVETTAQPHKEPAPSHDETTVASEAKPDEDTRKPHPGDETEEPVTTKTEPKPEIEGEAPATTVKSEIAEEVTEHDEVIKATPETGAEETTSNPIEDKEDKVEEIDAKTTVKPEDEVLAVTDKVEHMTLKPALPTVESETTGKAEHVTDKPTEESEEEAEHERTTVLPASHVDVTDKSEPETVTDHKEDEEPIVGEHLPHDFEETTRALVHVASEETTVASEEGKEDEHPTVPPHREETTHKVDVSGAGKPTEAPEEVIKEESEESSPTTIAPISGSVDDKKTVPGSIDSKFSEDDEKEQSTTTVKSIEEDDKIEEPVDTGDLHTVMPIEEEHETTASTIEKETSKPVEVPELSKPSKDEQETTGKPEEMEEPQTSKPSEKEEETTRHSIENVEDKTIVPVVGFDEPHKVELETTGKPEESGEAETSKPAEKEEVTTIKAVPSPDIETGKPSEDEASTVVPVQTDESETKAPLEGEHDVSKPVEGETTSRPAEKEDEATGRPAEKEDEATGRPVEKEDETTSRPDEKEDETSSKPVEKEDETSSKPVEKEHETSRKPDEKDSETEAPVEAEATTTSTLHEAVEPDTTRKPVEKQPELGEPSYDEKEGTTTAPVESDETETSKPTEKAPELEEPHTSKPVEKEEPHTDKPLISDEEKTSKPAQDEEEGTTTRPGVSIDEKFGGEETTTAKVDDEKTHKPVDYDLQATHKPTEEDIQKPVDHDHQIPEHPVEDEYTTTTPVKKPPGSGTGYPQPSYEPTYDDDYTEEDEDPAQFGPGTCRYGGKLYVSAQQIPRDDPCDFCFCFRGDIICLQQSCPPPIQGCHEEPISGFCCPRYECHVKMATIMNITTSTTTTTTSLPPTFLHSYKGAATKSGCQIQGKAYAVGEEVHRSSGPCMRCVCGGDAQMKCEPKACSPAPMLQQMIASAAQRRRR